MRLVRVSFCTIDSGICGRVEHPVRALALQACAHRVHIRDIEIAARESRNAGSCGRRFEQRPADLSFGSGDDHLHGRQSVSARPPAAASLADRIGIVPGSRGHSIANRRVVPADRPFRFRIVVVGALVHEIGDLAQRPGSRGRNPADPQRAPVVRARGTPTQWPKVGEPRRMSTATSKTSPASRAPACPAGARSW